MIQNSFYTFSELTEIGFKHVGDNVLISRFANFYGPHLMEIGNNVRIDDFCIISGKITIGNFVHISAYVALYGGEGIVIGDFSGISPRCSVFSVSDDFSGEYLIGPMVPEQYTHVKKGKVVLEKYVQVGAGSIVLPDVTLQEGAVTGAMSLITKSLEPWTVSVGIPARFFKTRKKDLLTYSQKLQINN